MSPERIDSAEAASAAAGASGDLLLTHIASRWVPSPGSYALGGAVALTVQLWGEPQAMALGPTADVVRLLAAVADDLGGVTVSVRRDTAAALPGRLPWRPLDDWAFRWTDAPPPRPVPDSAAAWLPVEAAGEVGDLLDRGFADASKRPHDPAVRRWSGVRLGDGRLVACAADATAHPSLGFIASVASDPALRGAGYGATVSAWTTEMLRREHGRAGLWHMAGNRVADALYTALGYRDEHRMTALEPSGGQARGGSDRS